MAGGRMWGTSGRPWSLGDALAVTVALFSGLAWGVPAPSARTPALGLADPARSVPAAPDYAAACAMSGLDDAPGCLRGALAAIDDARAREGVGPMRLPADLATLPFDRQLLIVIDRERVDRGLPPVAGVSPVLDRLAAAGARADDLPPAPGAGYVAVRLDADAGYLNALDLDYLWVYDDGPGSGTSGCARAGDPGCWADRHVVLARFPAGARPVLGAAQDPRSDTQDYDRGGPAMAVVLAAEVGRTPVLSFTWSAATHGTGLVPVGDPGVGVSATGIADPAHTEPGHYLGRCAASGLDGSAGCQAAVLAAIDRARAAEGVAPMVLPPGFAAMSTVEQLFVVTDLERVARGLPPFVGLTAALDANAAVGARTANDPPGLDGVIGEDGEWAGGSVSALDADYGWMYDDGRGSGNIDCPRTGGAGCWGHRNGILDDFGTVGTMAMGAAYDPTGDTAAEGWAGGTSMAITLAAEPFAPRAYTVTWAQVEACTPGVAP